MNIADALLIGRDLHQNIGVRFDVLQVFGDLVIHKKKAARCLGSKRFEFPEACLGLPDGPLVLNMVDGLLQLRFCRQEEFLGFQKRHPMCFGLSTSGMSEKRGIWNNSEDFGEWDIGRVPFEDQRAVYL